MRAATWRASAGRLQQHASASPLRTLSRAFRPSIPALAEVPIADLHKLGAEALAARGYQKQESDVLLDVMLWSQLREGGAPSGGLAAITSGALVRPTELETPGEL